MSMAVLADELFLWTGAGVTWGFHGVDGSAKHRDSREVAGVSLEVLPVDGCVANPLLHEGV